MWRREEPGVSEDAPHATAHAGCCLTMLSGYIVEAVTWGETSWSDRAVRGCIIRRNCNVTQWELLGVWSDASCIRSTPRFRSLKPLRHETHPQFRNWVLPQRKHNTAIIKKSLLMLFKEMTAVYIWESYETDKYNVWAKCSYWTLQQVVCIVTGLF